MQQHFVHFTWFNTVNWVLPPFFLLIKDLYYSETRSLIVCHIMIQTLCLHIQHITISFDSQGRAWLMFDNKRLKFNLLKQSEPTYSDKFENLKQQLTKMESVLKKKQYFIENLYKQCVASQKVDLLKIHLTNERLPYFTLFYYSACNLCNKMIGVTRILYY